MQCWRMQVKTSKDSPGVHENTESEMAKCFELNCHTSQMKLGVKRHSEVTYPWHFHLSSLIPHLAEYHNYVESYYDKT